MSRPDNFTERRQYPRYDMYLPVHFHIKASRDDSSPDSMKYYQGFTKNFSKGGILIEAINLTQHQMKSIESLEVFIEGSILLPNHPKPIRFLARPAWFKKEENNIELIGMYLTEIRKEDMDTLLDYARMINRKNRFAHLLGTLLINAIIAFILMALYIHFTYSSIITRQSNTIKQLQKNQENINNKIISIFRKN
jgi:hypothetical protein